MKKQTQCEAILAYLRRHKRATNMELVQKLWIASPWTRISEMIGGYYQNEWGTLQYFHDRVSRKERITRRFIRTPSGKRVVLYELVRA